MLRSLLLAFIVLFAAAFSAHADTSYRDPSGRFSVTVPDGWLSERPKQESPLGLLMVRQTEADIGVCLILVLPNANTRGMTQAELDEAGERELTKEYWRTAFAQSGATDVEVEDAGFKELNGRKAFYALASATYTQNGVSARSKSKQYIHMLPGSVHAVMCLTGVESYAAFSPNFETIFDSYVPGNALIAMGPPPATSTLALFSGARFDGARRVLGVSTPNLAQLGWSTTSSFTASGPSAWQICEGANYSGRCSVVQSGASANFGGRGVLIGSARQMNVRAIDPRSFLGQVSQATSMSLRTALPRMPLRRR